MSALALVCAFGMTTPVLAADETIVDIAVGNEDFSTLVELVVAEDLVETLASDGPFTVFAPTNDAFAALPAFVSAALERNPELVSEVLLYHVVSGELLAEDVLSTNRLTTVQGEELRVRTVAGKPYVQASQIVATDIVARNGVIHVIDRVLLPNSVYASVIRDIRTQVNRLIESVGQRQREHAQQMRPTLPQLPARPQRPTHTPVSY